MQKVITNLCPFIKLVELCAHMPSHRSVEELNSTCICPASGNVNEDCCALSPFEDRFDESGRTLNIPKNYSISRLYPKLPKL